MWKNNALYQLRSLASIWTWLTNISIIFIVASSAWKLDLSSEAYEDQSRTTFALHYSKLINRQQTRHSMYMHRHGMCIDYSGHVPRKISFAIKINYFSDFFLGPMWGDHRTSFFVWSLFLQSENWTITSKQFWGRETGWMDHIALLPIRSCAIGSSPRPAWSISMFSTAL